MDLIKWILTGFLTLFSDPFNTNPRGALFIFNLQDFNKKSIEIQKDFCIENGEYAITIMFYAKKNDPKRVELSKTLGLSSNFSKNNGIPISGVVEINSSDQKIALRKIFIKPKSMSTYKGRYAFLIEKKYLKKGCYKIKLNMQQDSIIFPETKAQLNIEDAYLGK